MKRINSKIILAQLRAKQALQNNDGMEVIQFLAIALVGIAIAGLLAGFGTTYLESGIKNVGQQITALFPASGG